MASSITHSFGGALSSALIVVLPLFKALDDDQTHFVGAMAMKCGEHRPRGGRVCDLLVAVVAQQ